MTVIPKKVFAENLKKRREQVGLSQLQISEQLGIERTRYACWETGKAEPSINMLVAISGALDISLDQMMKSEL